MSISRSSNLIFAFFLYKKGGGEKKMKMKKRGFTLIELLIVVLIIGILAAIALPQYQLAVGKSRAANALSMVNSAHQAIERYYLTHGSYPPIAWNDGTNNPFNTNVLNQYLDIDVPYKKDIYFIYYKDVYVSYGIDIAGGAIRISQTFDHAAPIWHRGIHCWTGDTSVTNSIPQKICKNICGHDNVVRLWGSGQFGCVLGVPEYPGV